ncbi:MAG: TetR family transcriptional regulator [Actinomycetota bacterium]|nr:TetR family transcriptional regulator [Actinomycetota bacterium]MDQ6947825.1 TetR family transcriptional regulator [Actinomycetota bacterium]
MPTLHDAEVRPQAATTEEALGRRERKKLATRQALHEAATDLVEERGLANVTVEAITERADVAVRTFFNYFPSKEEAVLEREPDRTKRLCRAIADRPAGEDPLTVLRQVVVHDLLLRELDPAHLLRRMRLIAGEPTLVALMAAHFEEMHTAAAAEIARRLGDDVPGTYAKLVVAAAFAACRVSLAQWCEIGGGGGDATGILNDAFDALATGLTPPPSSSTPAPSHPESPRA